MGEFERRYAEDKETCKEIREGKKEKGRERERELKVDRNREKD